MARTALTPITLGTGYAAEPVKITWTAADNVNGNSVPHTGREIVLFRNDNAGAQTCTISGVDCSHLRSEDCAKSVPASEYWATQMFPTAGWQQTDGYLYIDAGAADVYIAVLRVP